MVDDITTKERFVGCIIQILWNEQMS